MHNILYVLDTNVLIHDPQALFSFNQATVGIPLIVLEELDSFKSESSDRGRNARQVARYLDGLRDRGSLKDGVQLDSGGTLKILFSSTGSGSADNAIIALVQELKKSGQHVIFVSKDINARVKADVFGLEAHDYLKGRVAEYDLYKGWRSYDVPAVSLKKGLPPELRDIAADEAFTLNEFALLHSSNNPSHVRVFRYCGNGEFVSVEEPRLSWPFESRNPQQLMTMNVLLDPSIQLVSLIGPAGTGKTFLALLAGLNQVLAEHVYEKILISRPIIPLGPDIGYLPGDIQEKLHSWMQPIYDNMALIAHAAASKSHLEELAHSQREMPRSGKRFKRGHSKHTQGRDARRGSGVGTLDDMIHSGKISLDAITYMRGRSIPYQYILIDEVQNLTPHEVKTIITRVGQGSKIILAGDPYQIDSPYLDFSSNGLVVASNRFKGQSLFATVFMETSERSELSRLATQLL